VKYFFLSDGWTIGRVWELGGLWNESAWRRKPDISQINLCVWEKDEKLWLYRVEDAVLMVEVKPTEPTQMDAATQAIGQVVLKRLITADQAIERLCAAQAYQTATPG
jgi:DNA-binding IclR family transcriptional regulator